MIYSILSRYEKSSRFMKEGYERDFLRYLQSLLAEVERRIRRGHARLALSQAQQNAGVCYLAQKHWCGYHIHSSLFTSSSRWICYTFVMFHYYMSKLQRQSPCCSNSEMAPEVATAEFDHLFGQVIWFCRTWQGCDVLRATHKWEMSISL